MSILKNRIIAFIMAFYGTPLPELLKQSRIDIINHFRVSTTLLERRL